MWSTITSGCTRQIVHLSKLGHWLRKLCHTLVKLKIMKIKQERGYEVKTRRKLMCRFSNMQYVTVRILTPLVSFSGITVLQITHYLSSSIDKCSSLIVIVSYHCIVWISLFQRFLVLGSCFILQIIDFWQFIVGFSAQNAKHIQCI